jgi:CRP-like cAMP-binding protein
MGSESTTGYSIDFLQIRRSLENITPLPDSEWDFSIEKVKVKFLLKNTLLHKEGNICKNFYFIVHGGCRMFYVNSHANEISYDFIFAGNFMTAFSVLYIKRDQQRISLCLRTVLF